MESLRPADPRRLGGYELLGRLGQGGMGTVFLGERPDGRRVAVKMVRPEYAHDPEFRARFRGEAERARRVPTFCTAEVLDADPDHTPPYLVVEYVDGPSLFDVVDRNGPLEGGALHSVAVGVAAALVAIHGAGVIHRDLKPRNVLFGLGTPKVIDFGISRAMGSTSRHTSPEQMVGTIAYMAPESIEGSQITTAVDVFAWGAVVVYAATGRSPFGGETPSVTAARILTQPPRLEGLPPGLISVVDAALDKDPANRPTAPELLSRLLSAGTEPIPAEVLRAAEGAKKSSGRPRVRRRLAIGAGIAAAVVAVGSGLVAADQRSDDAPLAGPAPANSATQEGTRPPATTPDSIGPAIFDSLSSQGQFSRYADQYGKCEIADGALRVTTKTKNAMQCRYGPDAKFPERQVIGVDATLADNRSCAGVWFRTNGPQFDDNGGSLEGYQISVCPTEVTLSISSGDLVDEVASAAHAVSVGVAHEIVMVSDGSQATVSVDGVRVLVAPTSDPRLTGGTVVLGAIPTSGRAEVTFTDAQFRSGTDTGVPEIPGFVTGDAVLSARLWMLDQSPDYRTAVVEPAEFLTGAEYCRRQRLAATCTKLKTVPVTGSLQVTVPISADLVIREYRDGQPECVDRTTRAGLCLNTSRDRFSEWATARSPFPARLTVRKGVVVELAQLDLP